MNLRTFDGLNLHTQHWLATQARARVLLVHGLGEHIGRYAHVAAHLQAAGYSVSGFDHRGHGQSPGERGDTPHPHALLQDMSAAIQALPGAGPVVLLGHSMGGAVAARYVAEGLAARPASWYRAPDALVLSSPALAVGMNAFQRALLGFGLRFAPGMAAHNGLKPRWISRDAQVVAAYQADPLVHDRITPRLVRFIIDAGQAAREAAALWRTPTLLMWGGADRCVQPQGSQAFAAAAPDGVVNAQPWPALAHEIFNEPERAQVLAQLTQWLDARLPSQAHRAA